MYFLAMLVRLSGDRFSTTARIASSKVSSRLCLIVGVLPSVLIFASMIEAISFASRSRFTVLFMSPSFANLSRISSSSVSIASAMFGV